MKYFLLASSLFFSVSVFSQSGKLPFQGRLSQDGSAVNGPQDFVFSITALSWTESHDQVEVVDGFYSVILGSITPIPDSIFYGVSERTLAVSVNGTDLGTTTLYAPLTRRSDNGNVIINNPDGDLRAELNYFETNDAGSVVLYGANDSTKVILGTGDQGYTGGLWLYDSLRNLGAQMRVTRTGRGNLFTYDQFAGTTQNTGWFGGLGGSGGFFQIVGRDGVRQTTGAIYSGHFGANGLPQFIMEGQQVNEGDPFHNLIHLNAYEDVNQSQVGQILLNSDFRSLSGRESAAELGLLENQQGYLLLRDTSDNYSEVTASSVSLFDSQGTNRTQMFQGAVTAHGNDGEINGWLGYNWASGGSEGINRGALWLWADTTERTNNGGVDIRRVDLVVSDDDFGGSVGRLYLQGPVPGDGTGGTVNRPFFEAGAYTGDGIDYYGQVNLRGPDDDEPRINLNGMGIGTFRELVIPNSSWVHSDSLGAQINFAGGYSGGSPLDGGGSFGNKFWTGVNTYLGYLHINGAGGHRVQVEAENDGSQDYGLVYISNDIDGNTIELSGDTGSGYFMGDLTADGSGYFVGDLTVDGNMNLANTSFGDNDNGVLIEPSFINFQRGGDGSGNGPVVLSLNAYDDGGSNVWGTLGLYNASTTDTVNVFHLDASNKTFDMRADRDGQSSILMSFTGTNSDEGQLSMTFDDGSSSDEYGRLNIATDGAGGVYGNLFLQDASGNSINATGEGNITASGEISGNTLVSSDGSVQTSDQRLKRDISPLRDALAKTKALNGVTYYWKDESKNQNRQTGVIAQEVEEVFPEFVVTKKDGYKAVNYAQMVSVLIEAVKELDAKVDALENENDHLKAQLVNSSELDELRAEMLAIKKMLSGSSTIGK